MFSNALGLTMSQSDAMERQFEYNNMLMNIQNKYQKEAAAQSQQYAKDYWDYTNAENQKKHIKNAGLNPALMYGMSGSGGMGATGGAKQESPAQPQGNPIAMGLQVQALEQQKRLQDAEIAKTLAEADKADAEADKTRGVDSEKVVEEIKVLGKKIEEIKSVTDLNKANEALTKMNEKIADLEREIKSIDVNYRDEYNIATNNSLHALATLRSNEAKWAYDKHKWQEVENSFQWATYQERFRQTLLTSTLIKTEIALNRSGVELNDEKRNALKSQMQLWAAQASALGKNAQAYVDYVNGQIERWKTQSKNEKWDLTLKTISVGLDAAIDIGSVFFPAARIGKKIVRNKKGEVIREELVINEEKR